MKDPGLAEVAAFLAVAERGGFATAARELGVTQSTISRRVAALESQIGAQLVMRTTRRVALTEAGATYARELRDVLAGLNDAHARVRNHATEPEGLVRLTMPTALGRTRVVPLIAQLHQRYPRLRFDLDLSDRYVDMADDTYDIAVRLSDAMRSGLQSERIGQFGIGLFCSPAYAEARGLPASPDALNTHDVLALKTYNARTEWQALWHGRACTLAVSPNITATDSHALKALALAGVGLAVFPSYLVTDEVAAGTLVSAMAGLSFAPRDIYATYFPHRAELTKVQTVLQALRAGMGTV